MIKNYGSKLGGIGLYSNELIQSKFIHIDTRDKKNSKEIISWYYNASGQYISSTTFMKSLASKHGYKLIG